jgi:hypothetical protein
MKKLCISKFKEGLLLTTQFDTSAVSNPKIDALVNLLDLAITSCNADSDVVSNYELYIKDVDEHIFVNKLRVCKFSVRETERLCLTLKQPKSREPIILAVKPKNCYITIPLDTLRQLVCGSAFKGFEVVSTEPFLSVEQVLEITLKTIPTRTSFAFSTVDFISRVEESNRILSRLQEFFKNTDRLEFWRTRRTQQLLKVYEELYSKDFEASVGDTVELSTGNWKIVDGHRIYGLVYKFGMKNSKFVYKFKGMTLFRGFKGDYVFIIDDKILESKEVEVRIRVKPLLSLLPSE